MTPDETACDDGKPIALPTNDGGPVLSFVKSIEPAIMGRLLSSPLARRLASGVSWSLLGAVIARILGLLSSVCVARILGKAGFGELGIIQTTLTTIGVVAGFGLGTTATKYISEYKSVDRVRTGKIIAVTEIVATGTGLASALILIGIAPWLSVNVLADERVSGLLRVGAVNLFLSGFLGSQTGVLSGLEAFKALAQRNLIAGAATVPLMVGGAHFAGTLGSVWGLVLASLLNWSLNFISIRRECRKQGILIRYQGCLTEWRQLWTFSVPTLLSGMMVGPAIWLCSTILVRQPQGYASMGIYNAANQWYNAIIFMPSSMCGAFTAVMSATYGSRDIVKFKKVFTSSLVACAVTAVAPAAVIIGLSGHIMRAYGQGFVAGKLALIFVVLAAAFAASQMSVINGLVAMRKVWHIFAIQSIWAVALILTFYQLRRFGAVGLSAALMISYLLQFLICMAVYWYLVNSRVGVPDRSQSRIDEAA